MNKRLAYALAAAVFASGCAAKTAPRVTPGAVAQPPAAPPASRFVVTAYCRGTITASGAQVRAGVVAADPAVIPLGSVVRITGLAPYDGTYSVLDTGPGIRGPRIDLYMIDCAAARRFGRRTANVSILSRAGL